MGVKNSCYSRPYKNSENHKSAKDWTTRSSSSLWLGPREKQVLSRIFELGLVVFKPSDLGLELDRRRINDVLRRLTAKGILVKLSRGVYKVASDIRKLLALPTRMTNGKETGKDSDETRSSVAPIDVGNVHGMKRIVYVEGPFLDNVDAYTYSGKRVRGEKIDRSLSELSFFSKVNYAEILYRVEGVEVFGTLVIYQKNHRVRIEWRPPRGFVKRNGLASGLRMYWEMLLAAFKAILYAILKEGPIDIKQRMLRMMVDAGLKQLLCV